MNVILENNGKTVEYKIGPALYLLLDLIPILGSVIVFIIAIVKKQFRGYCLNQILLRLIYIFILLLSFIPFVYSGNYTLYIIAYLTIMVFRLYILVMYVLNANRYSVKQRLDDGFRVVNIENIEIQQFVSEAEAVNKPFWQFTRF